jgi:hypothetical protein
MVELMIRNVVETIHTTLNTKVYTTSILPNSSHNLNILFNQSLPTSLTTAVDLSLSSEFSFVKSLARDLPF